MHMHRAAFIIGRMSRRQLRAERAFVEVGSFHRPIYLKVGDDSAFHLWAGLLSLSHFDVLVSGPYGGFVPRTNGGFSSRHVGEKSQLETGWLSRVSRSMCCLICAA